MAEKYTLTQSAVQWLVEKIKGADDGVKELKKRTRVNLLRPTLGTTTINGVTCTNNGDGTYTLNGTNTSADGIILWFSTIELNPGKYKVLGSPNYEGVSICGSLHGCWPYDGDIVNITEHATYNNAIVIYSGVTCNNVVVKPMITTDLTATYDDFVSFEDSLQPSINTGLKMDLLWTNASPTSEFAPQKINVDLSKYKMAYILFNRTNYNANYRMNVLLIKNHGTVVHGHGNGMEVYRYVNIVSDSGVDFAEGNIDATVNNKYGIPYQIYGVK